MPEARSGKVDVSVDACFTGRTQQGQQMRTFGLTRTASDQDDQTGKGLLLFQRLPRQSKKVIAVAAQDDPTATLRVCENLVICCGNGQCIPELFHFVAPMTEQLRRFVGHVVIEQKPHRMPSLICSAIKASISVRWSS